MIQLYNLHDDPGRPLVILYESLYDSFQVIRNNRFPCDKTNRFKNEFFRSSSGTPIFAETIVRFEFEELIFIL